MSTPHEDFGRVLFTVPARGGSSGLRRKVLCEVGGRPLLWYTVEFLRRIAPLENIAVVTDDDEVEEFSRQMGVRIVREPFVPPEEGNTVKATQRVVRELEAEGETWPFTVIAQPTQPVRSVGVLRRCVSTLCKESARNENIDGCLTVMAVDSPGLQLQLDEDGRIAAWLLKPGIRQDMEPVFRVSGNFYVFRTDRFMAKAHDPRSQYENLSWVTEEHPSFPWVDIDTEKDRILFELIMKAGYWNIDMSTGET